MSGLYYLVFGIAILAIIWWCLSNDKRTEIDGFKGLLAIRTAKTKNTPQVASEIMRSGQRPGSA